MRKSLLSVRLLRWSLPPGLSLLFLTALVSAQSASSSPPPPAVRARGVGNPWINLRDSIALPARFEGPRDVRWQLERSGQARALAAADLDEDGVLDLVVGYDLGSSGAIAIYRGNVDAIYPYSPEARQRRTLGTFVDAPFLAPARLFSVPVPAELLGAGDFDGDGHRDLVIAKSGDTRLLELGGDGTGRLEPGIEIVLEGAITALEIGEVNRRDGLEDLVVAIDGASGPAVLVFQHEEGALRSAPETFSLPAPATDLLLTQANADGLWDLMAAAGDQLVTFYGHDPHRAGSAPRLPAERRALGFEVVAIERGNFDLNATGNEIALLGADGELRILGHREEHGGAREAAGIGDAAGSRPGRARPEGSVASDRQARQKLEPDWEVGPRVPMMARGSQSSAAQTSESRPSRLIAARVSSRPGHSALGFGERVRGMGLVSAAGLSAVAGGNAASRSQQETLSGPGDGAVALTLRSSASVVDAVALRLTPLALDSLVVLSEGSRAPLVITSAAVTTFTVDDTGDEPDFSPGGGICVTVNNTCTLRAAIEEANASAGADDIQFNLPLPPFGNPVIAPATQLPSLTEAAAILGSSQPSGTVNLLGGSAPAGTRGLGTEADATTFEGLVIAAFGNHGIVIDARNSIVEGNVIGKPTPFSFTAGNGGNGALVLQDGNTIGGSAAAARNQISGNIGSGVLIQFDGPGVPGNVVQGNYIGTDSAGAAASGNGGDGVAIDCISTPAVGNNLIGGLSAGEGNVIAANQGAGVRVSCLTGNSLGGNRIGTDAAGTSALGNGEGVVLLSEDNIAGMFGAAGKSFISGNGTGVRVGAQSNEIRNSSIGLTPSGGALGNIGAGIQIDAGSNLVNQSRIAHNGGGGVVIPTAVGVQLLGSDIFDNTGLGIDHSSDSVTFNDANESDDVQNFPVVSSVSVSGGSTSVTWSLHSTPNSSFKITFFRSSTCDPSGFGEGELLMRSLGGVGTDGQGNAGGAYDVLDVVPFGDFVTATATLDSLAGDRTSEFSFCRGRDDAVCPFPATVTIDSDINSGDHTIEACDSVTATAAMEGASTSVELKAPSIALGSGFNVGSGTSFVAGPP